MSLNMVGIDLDPKIKEIKTERGSQYTRNKTIVTLDVACKSEEGVGRKEIKIEYPMQGERHLVMLMSHVETGEQVRHKDKFVIRDAIFSELGYKEADK